MDKKGLVFAIEEFSAFDGAGIRTTVFFKGCPLKCSWCHNPEGQSFERQIVKSPNGCINCGSCVSEALRVSGDTKPVEECIKVCPRNLIRVSGKEYTASEIADTVLKNRDILSRTGGGVTFSGGEPLAQPDFLLSCLKTLRGKINRCIQTSGFAPSSVFGDILSESDAFLFDLKVIDPTLSLKYTGADINVILKNFDTLVKSGKDFTVRIPLIPGVTDTEFNIRSIAEILKFYRINYAEALPYNQMAGAKYKLCGREYLPDFDTKIKPHIPVSELAEMGIELKIL